MCRILAIKNFSYQKHLPLAKEFIALALTGKVPDGSKPGHLDGWGIGYYDIRNNKRRPLVVKSGVSITLEEKKFTDILAAINTTPVLIAHLRKSAWRGTSDERHAHPFSCQEYLFAHNGTVRDYKKFIPLLSVCKEDDNHALDTEVIFHYIISQMKDKFCIPPNKLCLKNIFNNISALSSDYTALNSVFSDGKNIWAYRDCTREQDYYTLYEGEITDSRAISSEILPSLKNPRLIDNKSIAEI